MKPKPYTGPESLEMSIRTLVNMLDGKLTLSDNAAVKFLHVVWNTDRALVLAAPTRPPLSIVMLRASRLDTPGSFASGGAVYWVPQPNGDILITGIGSLSGSVEWSVDLVLVES